MAKKIYRPNVAAIVLSPKYPEKVEILIANRVDLDNIWQMPQGGIDDGETPKQALLRELKEEIGTDEIEIIGVMPKWVSYDFPEKVADKMKPYVGQRQKYFLVKLKPNAKIYKFLDFFEQKEIEDLKKNFKFAPFLFDNYLLAMSFLKKEGISFSIKDIDDLKLKGRFEEIEKDLWIDVGHNPLAAREIAKALTKKVNLVYNTYADKDYEEILKILKPKIDKLYLIDVDNPRIEKKENIKKIAKKLEIAVEDFRKIKKPLLVFGSFSVVEEFLRRFSG